MISGRTAITIALIGWSLCIVATWVSSVRMTALISARVLAVEAEAIGQTKRIDELCEALRLTQIYAEGTRSTVNSRVMGGK